MQSTPPPPSHSSQVKKGLLVSVGGLLLVGLTAGLTVGTQSMGFLRTTNVGSLPELASIQAQLLPLAACEIEYGRRGDRRRHGSSERVKVVPCSKSLIARVIVPVWVNVPVPPERQVDGVTFDMTRNSMSEPWKILVEKDAVAFPELKRSLEQLAPVLLEQYPVELRKYLENKARWAREARERKDAERARKEDAKSSYPE